MQAFWGLVGALFIGVPIGTYLGIKAMHAKWDFQEWMKEQMAEYHRRGERAPWLPF